MAVGWKPPISSRHWFEREPNVVVGKLLGHDAALLGTPDVAIEDLVRARPTGGPCCCRPK